MSKPKQISEYTDRELIERIAMRTAEGAEAAKWTKNYIIITSIIAVVLYIIALV